MSSNKFNKISKYIKIAYLRWQQYCNSLQEISVPSKNSSKGEEIQNDFLKLKFSELVKFDGGSEFFFDSKDYWQHLTGKNSPSGFAIKVRKL